VENVVVSAFAWSQLLFFSSVLCALVCLSLDIQLVRRWDEVRLAGRPFALRRFTWIMVVIIAGLVMALQINIQAQAAQFAEATATLLLLVLGFALVAFAIGQIIAYGRRFNQLDAFYQKGHQIAHS